MQIDRELAKRIFPAACLILLYLTTVPVPHLHAQMLTKDDLQRQIALYENTRFTYKQERLRKRNAPS